MLQNEGYNPHEYYHRKQEDYNNQRYDHPNPYENGTSYYYQEMNNIDTTYTDKYRPIASNAAYQYYPSPQLTQDTVKPHKPTETNHHQMFDQSKDWTTISYTENSHHPSPSRLTPIKDVSKDESKLTEHEKRKKFLERNRIAASKCRERKKLWMKDMEVQVIELNKTNKELMFNNHQLQGLVADLAARLGKYEEVVFNLPPSQRILKKK